MTFFLFVFYSSWYKDRYLAFKPFSHFTMVLQVAEQWDQFFTAAGIPSAEFKTYAATFVTSWKLCYLFY